MIGQMYVQYVHLADADVTRSAADVARRRHDRGELGNDAGRPPGLADVLPARGLLTPTCRMPSNAAAPPGRRIPRSMRRRRISEPPRKPGGDVPVRPAGFRGIPILRRGARIRACAFPLRRSMFPVPMRAALGLQRRPDAACLRQPTSAPATGRHRAHPQPGRQFRAYRCRKRAGPRARRHLAEPSGAPDPAEHDLGDSPRSPHLFVWGDYLDRHSFWRELRPAVERWRDALQGRLRRDLARIARAWHSRQQPCP